MTIHKADVKVGGTYAAKVNGAITAVRIDSESPYGGWNGTNMRTHREVRIRSAAKLRYELEKLPDGRWGHTGSSTMTAQWSSDNSHVQVFRAGSLLATVSETGAGDESGWRVFPVDPKKTPSRKAHKYPTEAIRAYYGVNLSVLSATAPDEYGDGSPA